MIFHRSPILIARDRRSILPTITLGRHEILNDRRQIVDHLINNLFGPHQITKRTHDIAVFEFEILLRRTTQMIGVDGLFRVVTIVVPTGTTPTGVGIERHRTQPTHTVSISFVRLEVPRTILQVAVVGAIVTVQNRLANNIVPIPVVIIHMPVEPFIRLVRTALKVNCIKIRSVRDRIKSLITFKLVAVILATF